MQFDIDIVSVDGCYPYESAWCAQTLMTFKKDEEWRALHQELAGDMGRQPDNKEIYQVTLDCGRTVYLGFFDFKVRLALGCHWREAGLGFIHNPQ